MLSEIRDYLAARGRAPLSDIALRLGVPADAARGMIQHLVRKGRVARLESCSSCSRGCGSCTEAAASEIYEWKA